MEAMTDKEARKWCPRAGLKVIGRLDILRYKQPKEHEFFIKAPELHREIVALAYTMLTFPHVDQFSGGLLWLKWWTIGSPPYVWSGWRILEDMRRAHGEIRSLEIAPAQSFREDEKVELHAFLIQVIAYEWRAYFIPFFGEFFVTCKTNGQICVTAKSPETLKELRVHFKDWKPTDKDPMLVRKAELEKEHWKAVRKARRKSRSGRN